ncbi:hypothetical protein EGW08_008757, partial [Elysia chlorotica]
MVYMTTTTGRRLASGFLVVFGLTALLTSISAGFSPSDGIHRRERRLTTLEGAHHLDSNSKYESLNPPKTTAQFLSDVNWQLRQLKHSLAQATWDFQINGSVENRDKLINMTEKYNSWYVHRKEEALTYKDNPNLPREMARQLDVFSLTAIAKSVELRRRQTHLENTMESSYNLGVGKLSNKTSRKYVHTDPLTVMS